eukprot:350136-Chlamydomonas_euryale.AAC.27
MPTTRTACRLCNDMLPRGARAAGRRQHERSATGDALGVSTSPVAVRQVWCPRRRIRRLRRVGWRRPRRSSVLSKPLCASCVIGALRPSHPAQRRHTPPLCVSAHTEHAPTLCASWKHPDS